MGDDGWGFERFGLGGGGMAVTSSSLSEEDNTTTTGLNMSANTYDLRLQSLTYNRAPFKQNANDETKQYSLILTPLPHFARIGWVTRSSLPLLLTTSSLSSTNAYHVFLKQVFCNIVCIKSAWGTLFFVALFLQFRCTKSWCFHCTSSLIFSWRVCAFCCSLQQGSSSSSEQLQAASSSSLE